MTHHYARKRPRIVVPDGCFHRQVLGKAVPPLWCALISSSKCKAALCTPICPASTMAAPKNTTSNGSDFWRRDGIAQALPNKIIQLRSSLCFPPPCLPGARRAAVWPVALGGVLPVGRPLLDAPALGSQFTSVHRPGFIPRCYFFRRFQWQPFLDAGDTRSL